MIISILLPVYNTEVQWIRSAIDSVVSSSDPCWELCIADDASTHESVRKVLQHYVDTDTRIKVCFREINGHISEASNSALEMATGDWIVLMDHDDILPPNTLEEVRKVICENPEVRLIYSDEVKIDEELKSYDPYFKSSWNRDLFNSHNMISHLGVYHASTLKKIGGFRKGLEGSQDYDMALRFIEEINEKQIHHIPKVLYHWRSHSESTASTGQAKPYAVVAGERAINDHLQRTGSRGRCTYDGVSGYRVRYPLPQNLVGISAIIRTNGNQRALLKCLERLRSIKETLEILVLPVTPGAFDDIGKLKQADGVAVFQPKENESYPSLLNRVADRAAGDVLYFLHDHLEEMDEEALPEIISHAVRPDIGAVGGMILYPDGRVRQAGRLLDPYRISCPSFHHWPGKSWGYSGRLTLIQNYSAVSMDCMVIEKRKFLEVGGFDKVHLKSNHLDVDLCLRLKDAGYRTLWTPYAKFTDSISRFAPSKILGRFSSDYRKDCEWMQNRWGSLLKNDPAYNPNLNQKKRDFNYRWPPRENG